MLELTPKQLEVARKVWKSLRPDQLDARTARRLANSARSKAVKTRMVAYAHGDNTPDKMIALAVAIEEQLPELERTEREARHQQIREAHTSKEEPKRKKDWGMEAYSFANLDFYEVERAMQDERFAKQFGTYYNYHRRIDLSYWTAREWLYDLTNKLDLPDLRERLDCQFPELKDNHLKT